MATTLNPRGTEQEQAAKRLATAVTLIADRLRELARELDRHAAKVDSVGESGQAAPQTYGELLGDVLSSYRQHLGQLPLERLAERASEADVARTSGR